MGECRPFLYQYYCIEKANLNHLQTYKSLKHIFQNTYMIMLADDP